ncbi:MAG: FAD-dependent oxidoreductase [Candidatus Methanomethylicaceae archaeon]
MGSGGLIAMDEDNCMVSLAQFLLQFTKDESCGKCTPCRAGIPQMLEIITRITEGKGKLEDLQILEELARTTKSSSLCGLGQTAANPVLTTLRYFRNEYEAHIIDKKCSAAICQALFRAPCQHTCPLEIDIPGYVALIKNGDFEKAYKLIAQRAPLPYVCGSVCHAPCESKCRRGQIDDPIAIRELKRFAVDWAHKNNVVYAPPVKNKNGVKVAIVGSGPAGLTAAHDLAREGYEVTIFEALPVAGGMLAVGIPNYRLPKDILEKEIEMIKRLGVKIILNKPVNDIDSLLKEGYKAVFIAVGCMKGIKMGIPGEDLDGVLDAIEFLKEVNLGKRTKVGKRVAVIGGGNSAIDAARVALRCGAESVEIFYRRDKSDMTAIPEEVEAAEEEGIKIHCLTVPTKILGRDGKVVGIECVKMELREFDKSGRRTPYQIPGSEYRVEVDMVIEAIGQRPDSSFLENKIKLGKGGTILVDPRTLATNVKGIFAGGDVVTGPATVTEAMAAGRRAASSIRRYCQGEELLPRPVYPAEETFVLPQIPPTDEETKEKSRVTVSKLSINERLGGFREIVKPYNLGEAVEESKRCLRCDLEVLG